MRRLLTALLLPPALLAAGCAGTTSSSSGSFKGAQADVAQVVDDLASAGRSRNQQKICAEVLASNLVQKLRAGGTTCEAEVDKAIQDADDFSLTVQRVQVNGARATARVRQGSDGPVRTFAFTREGGGWKLSSLG